MKEMSPLEEIRHSTAHVLAQVILEFYPKSKLTIGPAIDSGFYYDVDFGEDVFSENDFLKIEKRMVEISRKGYDFKMRECSKDEAIEYYKSEKNEYKLELIENIDDIKAQLARNEFENLINFNETDLSNEINQNLIDIAKSVQDNPSFNLENWLNQDFSITLDNYTKIAAESIITEFGDSLDQETINRARSSVEKMVAIGR